MNYMQKDRDDKSSMAKAHAKHPASLVNKKGSQS